MITVNDRFQFLYRVDELMPRKAKCCEIGVFNGDFSAMIRIVLMPIKLLLIDPFEKGGKQYPGSDLTTAYSGDENYLNVIKTFHEQIRTGEIAIHRDYSYNAIGRYYDDQFNFIYHDASHLYEDLKTDLNEWLPKLVANGLMCGHDYCNELFPGVKQAVDEFCAEHNFEMIIFNENGGDYALRSIQ